MKPKMGLLLMASPRFKPLGAETPDGSYGQRKELEAQEIARQSARECEVIFPGIVYTRPEMEAAMAVFYNRRTDFILAMFLSWSEDFAWIRFLRDFPKTPLIYACPIREECRFTNTGDENEFIDFLASGSVVGALEGSGSLRRMNREMTRHLAGTLPEILERARIFGQAAALRSHLRQAVFGLLACYNEAMWSTYVDPYNLFKTVGPELRFLSVATLVTESEAIPAAAVEAKVLELSRRYPVEPDVDPAKFAASVRVSMAVENMAAKAGLDLIVLNDIDKVLFEYAGLRPGFIPCLTGIPVAPEGDLGNGLALYALQKLSGQHVNFIEPFFIDKKTNTFGAGHAGPNDYTDPAGRVKIARDVRFAKTGYRHAGAPFAWYLIPPGTKTMTHVSECNGRFKMACSLVDALPWKHTLVSYSHGLLKPKIPVGEFFEKLSQVGVNQHYALAEGDHTAHLREFAYLMDFEFHTI